MMIAVTNNVCSLTFVVTKRLVTNWWQDVHDIILATDTLHGCFRIVLIVIPRVWGWGMSHLTIILSGLCNRGAWCVMTIWQFMRCPIALCMGVMLTGNVSNGDVSGCKLGVPATELPMTIVT